MNPPTKKVGVGRVFRDRVCVSKYAMQGVGVGSKALLIPSPPLKKKETPLRVCFDVASFQISVQTPIPSQVPKEKKKSKKTKKKIEKKEGG